MCSYCWHTHGDLFAFSVNIEMSSKCGAIVFLFGFSKQCKIWVLQIFVETSSLRIWSGLSVCTLLLTHWFYYFFKSYVKSNCLTLRNTVRIRQLLVMKTKILSLFFSWHFSKISRINWMYREKKKREKFHIIYNYGFFIFSANIYKYAARVSALISA